MGLIKEMRVDQRSRWFPQSKEWRYKKAKQNDESTIVEEGFFHGLIFDISL